MHALLERTAAENTGGSLAASLRATAERLEAAPEAAY
jgi:hypothetical protein